jgi:hypothetical protein
MDNVYMCLRCGGWFPTADDRKNHKCNKVVSTDNKIIIDLEEKKAHKKDPDIQERREIGEKLKKLGIIEKRSEITFKPIEEVRQMLQDAEIMEDDDGLFDEE